MPSMYSGNNIMDQIQGFLSLIPGTKQNKDWRTSEDLQRAAAIEQARSQMLGSQQQNQLLETAQADPRMNVAMQNALMQWQQQRQLGQQNDVFPQVTQSALDFQGAQTKGMQQDNAATGREDALASLWGQPSGRWSLAQSGISNQQAANATQNRAIDAGVLGPMMENMAYGSPEIGPDGKATGRMTPDPRLDQLQRYLFPNMPQQPGQPAGNPDGDIARQLLEEIRKPKAKPQAKAKPTKAPTSAKSTAPRQGPSYTAGQWLDRNIWPSGQPNAGPSAVSSGLDALINFIAPKATDQQQVAPIMGAPGQIERRQMGQTPIPQQLRQPMMTFEEFMEMMMNNGGQRR